MLTTEHRYNDTRIFHKEAKSLKKCGHLVNIIAPGKFSEKKIVDGIDVVIVKKSFTEMLHFITMFRLFWEGIKNDSEIYHCHEPGSLFVCLLIKLFKRKKLVYDAHEHYPSLMSAKPRLPEITKKPIHYSIDKFEIFSCRFADHIITVNKSLYKRYEPFKKVTILYNVPSLELFPTIKTSKNKEIIVYSGIVSRKRGLDKLLDSIRKIKSDYPNILLLIPGYISDTKNFKQWVNAYINENNLSGNFKVTGLIPYEEVLQNVQTANIGMILFQPTYYNNIIGLPNKLFEYMACGVPVIASNFPEIQKIVEETKCGKLVDPTKVDEITEAILWMLEHPGESKKLGQNGRRAIEDKYNWEYMEKRLCQLYEELK
jgi:glycosyltransferase involved in cell wall biosynthesis